MPTQIIDGFKLNASTPIDSRLVTTGTASRNTMTYKYEGLRVYDTIQKKPFVYINGDWIEESGGTTTTTGGVKIDGTPNYIPKIISTGTTSSIIREFVTGNNERRIGINIPESTQIATTLHVGGTVTAANFVGSVAVTNIAGILPLSKITNANDTAKTYVLKSINNTNTWILETIGSTIKIDKDTNSEKLFFAFTNDKDTSGLGNSLYIVNYATNDLLAANAKTRQLMVGTNNTFTNPQYSFIDKTGNGMYGTSTEVGLSIDGNKRLYIQSVMVGINFNGVTTMKFEPTLTTITGPAKINGLTTITGDTSITGLTTITGNTSITGITTITGTGSVSMSLSVGNNITAKTGIFTPAADGIGISVTSNSVLSPPNKIINTNGTGLYIKSTGEGIRLDTQDHPTNSNYISFFKGGEGSSATAGEAGTRRGWLGYGNNTNTFYINNQVGEITLQPAAALPLNLQSKYYKNLVMYDDGIKLMGYSGHYWYFSQALQSGSPAQNLPITQKINPAVTNIAQILLYASNCPQYMVPHGGSETDQNRAAWNNPSGFAINSNTMELINQVTSKIVPPRAINKTLHDQWFMFRSKSLHIRVMLNMNPSTNDDPLATKAWVPINRPTSLIDSDTAQDFSTWQGSQGDHSAWSGSNSGARGWTTDQFFIPGGWEFVIEIQKNDPGVANAQFQGWGFSLGKVTKLAADGTPANNPVIFTWNGEAQAS